MSVSRSLIATLLLVCVSVAQADSHLLPFEIIIFGGGALAAIGVLRLARRLAAVRG